MQSKIEVVTTDSQEEPVAIVVRPEGGHQDYLIQMNVKGALSLVQLLLKAIRVATRNQFKKVRMM